ncbi:cysteine-rich venom protein pseudechetoxin-like isoform X2 [Lineus longissimus]|uniref:cysteine-rich venom protein pseudechetoxin-like isoform X2 n=1 Tax=Lineus longissimus TaxID=88925 RepID=UPI00315D5C5D
MVTAVKSKMIARALFFMVALPVLVVAVIEGDVAGDRFSKADKQKILDLHNEYRAKVARGQEGGQPQAADMIALEWDDRLEGSAQGWANGCRAGHNSADVRKFEPYIFVGQSYTYNYGLVKSMEIWYDEVKNPGYRYGGQFGGAGHYTQMIWGPTTKVGCAYKKCGSEAMVVCEFAPGGNLNWAGTPDKTYKRGSLCSACPAGYGYCMDGALCASDRACKNSDSNCECKVSSCQNGQFNRETCTCTCNAGWRGASCNEQCSNGDNCPRPDGPASDKDKFCRWNSQSWMWMMKECPGTCDRYCKPLPDLGGNHNSQGLKVNVKVVDRSSGGATSPPKGNCPNKHQGSDCDSWAASGECTRNPVWMSDNCARSCNTC